MKGSEHSRSTAIVFLIGGPGGGVTSLRKVSVGSAAVKRETHTVSPCLSTRVATTVAVLSPGVREEDVRRAVGTCLTLSDEGQDRLGQQSESKGRREEKMLEGKHVDGGKREGG